MKKKLLGTMLAVMCFGMSVVFLGCDTQKDSDVSSVTAEAENINTDNTNAEELEGEERTMTVAHTWEETGYYGDVEKEREVGTEYICDGCGYDTEDVSEIQSHTDTEETTYHEETVMETYTEFGWVSTGYQCKTCGATKGIDE